MRLFEAVAGGVGLAHTLAAQERGRGISNKAQNRGDKKGPDLPARSIRCSFPNVDVLSMLFRPRHVSVRMEWERDECSFMSCAPTARVPCPFAMSCSTSAAAVTATSVRPGTANPSLVCRISSVLLDAAAAVGVLVLVLALRFAPADDEEAAEEEEESSRSRIVSL